jgi:hypothetical protein
MFKDMEKTISNSKEPGFYKEWETRNLPWPERNYIEEEKLEAERKEKEKQKRETKEESEDENSIRKEMIERENFKIINNVLNKTIELNWISYRTKLRTDELVNETQNLKNKMSVILWRYKINEWVYDYELSNLSDQFWRIENLYKKIYQHYELINNELEYTKKTIYDYGRSWRIFDRTQQKTLNDLINQQTELKSTMERLRWWYWELETVMRDINKLSKWEINWVQTNYKWKELQKRELISNKIKQHYENWKYIENNINLKLNESKAYIDAIYQKSIKN